MFAWRVVLGFSLLGCFVIVAQNVNYPFMDEYFHARQALRYIELHDFQYWDPKITTPPGLYIVAFLSSYVFGSELTALRFVNLAPALIWLGLSKQSKVLPILGFPLLAFYMNLFYTDVWSTLLIMFSISTSSTICSAVLLFISLWFRQTNIVWTVMAAAFQVAEADTKVVDIYYDFYNLLVRLVKRCLPFTLVALSFAAFLLVNGSIALGDKTNHGFSLHLAQILYFLLFFAFFATPLALTSLYKGGKPWFWNVFGRLYLAPIELVAIYGILRYGTIVHPFILADNRHYTFYIWRRLITPIHGLAILPIYWAAWRYFWSTVNFSLLRTWIYIGALVAVLVPSPLMEPRYYILPYLVWRTYLYNKPASAVENLWNLGVSTATVAVFAFTKTHFMW